MQKHLPCFYRVIETPVEIWENEKCCGNTSHTCRRMFPQLLRVLPNVHKCFYNSIETQRTCLLFLLENTATRKRKTTCRLWLSKFKFSLPTSTARASSASPSSSRNTIFNQSARVFSQDCFLKPVAFVQLNSVLCLETRVFWICGLQRCMTRLQSS